MSIAIETFPVMPARPCSFCLSLQGGSVFADFDADNAGTVSLRRISFDGFGCCEVGPSTIQMNPDDSRLMLGAIAGGEIQSAQVEQILRRYFQASKEVIWIDALAEHDLL